MLQPQCCGSPEQRDLAQEGGEVPQPRQGDSWVQVQGGKGRLV